MDTEGKGECDFEDISVYYPPVFTEALVMLWPHIEEPDWRLLPEQEPHYEQGSGDSVT